MYDCNNREDALTITIDILTDMVRDKKRQIFDEPRQPMWQEELQQLERTIGLVEMEKQSYEN